MSFAKQSQGGEGTTERVFHETMLICLASAIMCLSDMIGDYATRATVGYVACGIIAFHLVASIALLTYTMLCETRKKLMVLMARRT